MCGRRGFKLGRQYIDSRSIIASPKAFFQYKCEHTRTSTVHFTITSASFSTAIFFLPFLPDFFIASIFSTFVLSLFFIYRLCNLMKPECLLCTYRSLMYTRWTHLTGTGNSFFGSYAESREILFGRPHFVSGPNRSTGCGRLFGRHGEISPRVSATLALVTLFILDCILHTRYFPFFLLIISFLLILLYFARSYTSVFILYYYSLFLSMKIVVCLLCESFVLFLIGYIAQYLNLSFFSCFFRSLCYGLFTFSLPTARSAYGTDWLHWYILVPW